MTLSRDTLEKTILEAADEANTVNKILDVTDISSNNARLATGVESIARFAKNILSDISTRGLEDVTEGLYGDNLPVFDEINSDTVGIGLVPVGADGSPQPLLAGILFAFGGGRGRTYKIQIASFTTGTVWLRRVRNDLLSVTPWQKLNGGILDHRFYYHTNSSPQDQTYYYDIPDTANTVLVRLRGAGGGGSAVNVLHQTGFHPGITIVQGNPAGHSEVRRLLTLRPPRERFEGRDFAIYAEGGTFGNKRSGTGIPDARIGYPRSTRGYSPHLTIPGLGSPGGAASSWVFKSDRSDAQEVLLPQDGLAGELAIGSFSASYNNAASNGRLRMILAAGGRARDSLASNGKGASAEVMVW